MWAIVKDDEVVGILRTELNVQIPGRDEVIGNLAILTEEQRRENGIYKVEEEEDVDWRYYAATYTRYEIDHERLVVKKINEIQAQPVDRIAKFRLEELKEMREKWRHGNTGIFYPRLLDGEKIVQKKVEVKVTDRMIGRLALVKAVTHNNGSARNFAVEDINGEVHVLRLLEMERLADQVSIHLENVEVAFHLLEGKLEQWKEEDPDGLIEWDVEQEFDDLVNQIKD